MSIFTYKVSIIRAFVKQAGILGFQLIILSLGLLVVIEKGPRLNQRAVFLGFPPIKNAKTGDVCSHDSKWSRAVQAGLAGFEAERHGVFFLDLECPLARLPHSSYAYRSPGHRHLPGGPDLANAILLQFLHA